MNILFIGTIDARGGAAQISRELREKLRADGHTVSMFVRYKYSDESDVRVIPRRRWQDWLVKVFANDLTFARSGFIYDTEEYKQADIIHCHNLHSNFFDLAELVRMSREKPVVWTLHDLWAITGFASDSATRRHPNKKRFLLYLWDTTAGLLAKKKAIYERSKLHLVAVSEWLAGEVRKSILKGQDMVRIYNGVDTALFKPRDRDEVRRELGLPPDKKIAAFGIKGWNDSNRLVDAYAGRDDVFFLALGHVHTKTQNKNFKAIPYLENRELISKYLSAADVFLYPTHGDTFGLIAAEAGSCGTPVVAYDTDALPEIVSHRITGYVARYDDAADLKAGLEYVLGLTADERGRMSDEARRHVRELFSLERMCAEYLDLYRRLLKK